MLGPDAHLRPGDHLLAHVANLIAAGNWQRGGGKGQRPKPIKLGGGKSQRAKKVDGDDIARRLANLGLIPGAPAA
ncbi:hypothetical protein [Polymorphospora lycopeni]|uniref:Uncharacterized protein n=1 Tax=Polymorphospora lycopeni TaxID=3140240 RepID=A0ABV5CKW0_9ACTN